MLRIVLQMNSPTPGQIQSHMVMNNNAMFLLDLACASNSNLVPPSLRKSSSLSSQMSRSGLSAVSELSHVDPNPFPLVPFQCCSALGVKDSQLKVCREKFAHETRVSAPELGSSQYFQVLNNELVLEEKLKGIADGNKDIAKDVADQISPPDQFKTPEGELEASGDTDGASKKPFSRSISVGWSPERSGTSELGTGYGIL